MRGVTPIDVAVCDPDLLWRVEFMNAQHVLNARDFVAIDEAFDGLTPGHGSVLAIGPAGSAEFDLGGLARMRSEHPDWLVAFVCDVNDPDVLARVTAAKGASVVDVHLGVAANAAAVSALLPSNRTAVAEADERAASLTDEGPAAVVPAPLGNLIIVTSAKAGEGVTTVAANIASALALDHPGEVALVEGDPEFGDLSLMRDLPDYRSSPRGEDDKQPLYRLIVRKRTAGWRFITPPGEDHHALGIDVAVEFIDTVLRETDTVVLDAPFELVRSTGIAAGAAAVLLVTSSRMASLKNALVASAELGHLDNIALIVNNADWRDRQQFRLVASALGVHAAAVLPRDKTLVRSGRTLSPEVVAPPGSRFAQACAELAVQVRTSSLTAPA